MLQYYNKFPKCVKNIYPHIFFETLVLLNNRDTYSITLEKRDYLIILRVKVKFQLKSQTHVHSDRLEI
jgi:hypothetical protein